MKLEIAKADITYPETTLSSLAFGSCHKNKEIDKNPNLQLIWPSIADLQPQSYLWLGDAIYSPSKKHSISPVELLKDEYDDLVSNSTFGYIDFLKDASRGGGGSSLGSVHGMYDDHDFGGNDFGKEMPNKDQRKEIFLDFLSSSNEAILASSSSLSPNDEIHKLNEKRIQNIQSRDGIYSSIEFGTYPQKVKVILLDTRSSRDKHCPIPSIGAMKLPFRLGSPLACITRWITAGLNLQNTLTSCQDVKMLSNDQWNWLEDQLRFSNNDDDDNDDGPPSVYIIGSSIQVLTTNPAIESWGHYPRERLRLLQLLNEKIQKGSAVVLLSGDVHHGEILDSSQSLRVKNRYWDDSSGRIIEVTSSGLTHS